MEAIIVTAITVFGGGILKLLSDYISNTQKNQKELINQLLKRMDTMELNQEELKLIGFDNRSGTKNILRYRLRQEMMAAIKDGFETASNYEEVVNMYGAYLKLGGNGVITELFEIYKKLTIKGV